jgi:hypothetical protein
MPFTLLFVALVGFSASASSPNGLVKTSLITMTKAKCRPYANWAEVPAHMETADCDIESVGDGEIMGPHALNDSEVAFISTRRDKVSDPIKVKVVNFENNNSNSISANCGRVSIDTVQKLSERPTSQNESFSVTKKYVYFLGDIVPENSPWSPSTATLFQVNKATGVCRNIPVPTELNQRIVDDSHEKGLDLSSSSRQLEYTRLSAKNGTVALSGSNGYLLADENLQIKTVVEDSSIRGISLDQNLNRLYTVSFSEVKYMTDDNPVKLQVSAINLKDGSQTTQTFDLDNTLMHLGDNNYLHLLFANVLSSASGKILLNVSYKSLFGPHDDPRGTDVAQLAVINLNSKTTKAFDETKECQSLPVFWEGLTSSGNLLCTNTPATKDGHRIWTLKVSEIGI